MEKESGKDGKIIKSVKVKRLEISATILLFNKHLIVLFTRHSLILLNNFLDFPLTLELISMS